MEFFNLDAAGAYGLEPFSQAIRIHSRGRANRLKIAVVVKKKLLRFTAKTQWAANPFFQSFCDHGAPKPFLRRPLIVNMQKRTFEHAVYPQVQICIQLSALLCAGEGPQRHLVQKEAAAGATNNGVLSGIVRKTWLGRTHRLASLGTKIAFETFRRGGKALKSRETKWK